jgi:beta-glucosidase
LPPLDNTSLATFACANLHVSAATVSPFEHVRITAEVTNTGPVGGDEVAQLYVGAQGSRVDRALNELRGFTRVHLEQGETHTVSFDLRAADLAFWDTAAGAWEVEPITYANHTGQWSSLADRQDPDRRALPHSKRPCRGRSLPPYRRRILVR